LPSPVGDMSGNIYCRLGNTAPSFVRISKKGLQECLTGPRFAKPGLDEGADAGVPG